VSVRNKGIIAKNDRTYNTPESHKKHHSVQYPGPGIILTNNNHEFVDRMISFNTVLNAFIDSLTFADIPQRLKTESLLSAPPGRDRVNTAVLKLISEWHTAWAGDVANLQKIKLIGEVEEKRALIERHESENGNLDEARVGVLLSDMVMGFKDGTYKRALEERDMFVVVKMSEFLNKATKQIPEAIQLYFQERLNMPR